MKQILAELEKVSKSLTGATKVTEKQIKEIADMTQRNDHFGSVMFIYKNILKNKKGLQAVIGLEKAHEFLGGFGKVPDVMYQLTSGMMKKELKSKLSDEDFKAVWSSL